MAVQTAVRMDVNPSDRVEKKRVGMVRSVYEGLVTNQRWLFRLDVAAP